MRYERGKSFLNVSRKLKIYIGSSSTQQINIESSLMDVDVQL